MEKELIPLFEDFVKASKSGRRIQKNGNRITPGTIENYFDLHKLLLQFSTRKSFPLRLHAGRLTTRDLKRETKYWKSFYKKFTDFLYNDKSMFDNSVGNKIKTFRTFLKYIENEKGIITSPFREYMHAPTEEIQILVLSTDRLKFLITDKVFEDQLSIKLLEVKDIFVFGCTVGLRYSDLNNLKKDNLETYNGKYYLSVLSKDKDQSSFTRILPYNLKKV